MKSTKIKYMVFTLLGCISGSQAWNTNFQLVGSIEILDNGAIRVGTTENSNKWEATGCGDVDQDWMLISNTTTARDQWLSLLMLAKSSSVRVKFSYSSCSGNVAGNATELVIQ